MHIKELISLLPYNTFGIDATAEYFAKVELLETVTEVGELSFKKHIIGGGSNILLTQNIEGLVLLNRLKGISMVKENDEFVWVKALSGEIWHDLVMYAVSNGWGGLENLSLIPGTVGASPMQNIGAYGVEARETIDTVTFWHWKEKAFITLSNSDCNFGYRDSIFKHHLKDQIFITSVVYKLRKHPIFNTSYGAIAAELENMKVGALSLKAISQAITNIRTAKLPDPKKMGNAGSFFKNPTNSFVAISGS